MREDNFYKFCISACIFMILISLSMNVVTALGIFTPAPSPLLDQMTQNQTMIGLTDFDITGLLGSNLTIAALAIAAAAIGIAAITGSWTIVGAVLFGVVFYGSWIMNIATFSSYGDFMSSAAMVGIYIILMVVMTFLFVGAVIGMLGGSD